MSAGDVGRQNAQYRKGLVLGLTVAEVMLLILFALLLALAVLIAKRDSSIAKLAAQLVEAAHLRETAQARADILQSMVEKRPPDQFVKELVRARERQQVLDAQQ